MAPPTAISMKSFGTHHHSLKGYPVAPAYANGMQPVYPCNGFPMQMQYPAHPTVAHYRTNSGQVSDEAREAPQGRAKHEVMVQVPKVEIIKRRVPMPRTQIVEKIVEYPEIQYREVPVKRTVEVPEVQTHVIVKEVETPVSVEVPVVQARQAYIEQRITKNIPVAVDVTTTQTFLMPKLKPAYHVIDVPIYVPRYIEIPVPAQFVEQLAGAQGSRATSSASARLATHTRMSSNSHSLTHYAEDQQQCWPSAGVGSNATPSRQLSRCSKPPSRAASLSGMTSPSEAPAVVEHTSLQQLPMSSSPIVVS